MVNVHMNVAFGPPFVHGEYGMPRHWAFQIIGDYGQFYLDRRFSELDRRMTSTLKISTAFDCLQFQNTNKQVTLVFARS
jgi:hypothetical protein